MLTMSEARERVKRGADHLNRVMPGWHNRIDTSNLQIADTCKCIVGQLRSVGVGDNFYQKMMELFPVPGVQEVTHDVHVYMKCHDVALLNGLDKKYAVNDPLDADGNDAYDILTFCWLEAIQEQRLMDSIHATVGEEVCTVF